MTSSNVVFRVDATDAGDQRLFVEIEVSAPFTSSALKLSFPRWVPGSYFHANQFNTFHIWKPSMRKAIRSKLCDEMLTQLSFEISLPYRKYGYVTSSLR